MCSQTMLESSSYDAEPFEGCRSSLGILPPLALTPPSWNWASFESPSPGLGTPQYFCVEVAHLPALYDVRDGFRLTDVGFCEGMPNARVHDEGPYLGCRAPEVSPSVF